MPFHTCCPMRISSFSRNTPKHLVSLNAHQKLRSISSVCHGQRQAKETKPVWELVSSSASKCLTQDWGAKAHRLQIKHNETLKFRQSMRVLCDPDPICSTQDSRHHMNLLTASTSIWLRSICSSWKSASPSAILISGGSSSFQQTKKNKACRSRRQFYLVARAEMVAWLWLLRSHLRPTKMGEVDGDTYSHRLPGQHDRLIFPRHRGNASWLAHVIAVHLVALLWASKELLAPL